MVVSHVRRHAHISAITIIMVVAIAAVMYFSYTAFVQNVELRMQVSDQIETIRQQAANITNLQDTVEELQDEIEEREATIVNLQSVVDTLSERLGLLEVEVEELTPVVRDYSTVGVRSSGEGIVIPLEVKVVKGDGSISVNINNVDLLGGTQQSIRIATDVAQDFTGTDTSEKDITVTFVNTLAETVTIDGPSAGSAITIAIIAALQERDIDANAMTTGTIRSDGAIGSVGSVAQKAQAARDAGATKFLVPPGQSTTVSGIEIIEVANINQLASFVLQ